MNNKDIVVFSGKFLSSKMNGIPRYAMEVIRHLDALLAGEKAELCFPGDISKENIPNLSNIKLVPYGKNGKGWDILYGERYAKSKGALYVNFASRGGLYKNRIVCIHDIRPLTWDLKNGKKTKHILSDKLNFYLAVHNSKRIITDSIFSKEEISSYYGASSDKFLVAPLGWEHLNLFNFGNVSLHESNFYFSIGSIAPHKNFEWILNVAMNNPESLFLVAGGVNQQIWNYETDFSKVPNVRFLGYISDEEMKWYMQHAKALLFPSLYEGFGIPPLEALALGTPVIASDIPVLREIYGNVIHYINPYKYDVNLDSLLQEPTESSIDILSKYTWENSALFWKDIIESCS